MVLHRPVEPAALIKHVDYFRFARKPSRIGGKRGDHCLQAGFPLLIAVSESDYCRVADNISGHHFPEPRFWPATANGLLSTVILFRNIASRRFQAFSFGI